MHVYRLALWAKFSADGTLPFEIFLIFPRKKKYAYFGEETIFMSCKTFFPKNITNVLGFSYLKKNKKKQKKKKKKKKKKKTNKKKKKKKNKQKKKKKKTNKQKKKKKKQQKKNKTNKTR